MGESAARAHGASPCGRSHTCTLMSFGCASGDLGLTRGEWPLHDGSDDHSLTVWCTTGRPQLAGAALP